jgi:hypothetical protein
MTNDMTTALDHLEERAEQAMTDYRVMGWTNHATVVDGLLSDALAAAWALDEHFAGLGL